MSTSTDLFTFAQYIFNNLIEDFAQYGLITKPGIELRRGQGLLCYCNLSNGHIYIAIPEASDPLGALKSLFMQSALGLKDNLELDQLIRSLLPWLLAHELAHHYRWNRGLFGKDLWQEEQIANRLASAAVEHRLSGREKEETYLLLRKTFQTLAQNVESSDTPVATFDDLLEALKTRKILQEEVLDDANLVGQIFDRLPEEVLHGDDALSRTLEEKKAQRSVVIRAFNEDYTSDVLKYAFFQIGWMLIALESREQVYVDEFVRKAMQMPAGVLSPISRDSTLPTKDEVRACYAAHHYVASASSTASRYFYKRYRSLLLTLLASQDGSFLQRAASFLDEWEEGDHETLILASTLAPAELLPLFPHRITANCVSFCDVDGQLLSEVDRRMWRHVGTGQTDAEAERTLKRLDVFEGAPLFRCLPADFLLELNASICRFFIKKGQPIIRQGSRNDDVYVLVQGSLEVVTECGSGEAVVGQIMKNELFGEMAFLTRCLRTATVRATENSECLVLKASELRFMIYKHPSVAMEIARSLARRFERAPGVRMAGSDRE